MADRTGPMNQAHRELPLQDLPIHEARRRALERAIEASGGGDQSVIARPLVIPSRAGRAIPARTYHPPTASGTVTGAVVFFHGGGWVYGDLDSHDGMCRDLAAGSNCILVAVEYRLAPEHPFPAALDDARDALDWVLTDPTRLGSTGTRVAVAGDSSGGNLAAAACLDRRDRNLPGPAFQLLLYPCLDLTLTQPSIISAGGRRFGGRSELAWTVDQYLSRAGDRRHPLASPLLAADHGGLPPAHVVTAGYDPLRDEGLAFVAALAAAGVPVTHRHYEHQIHGFLSFAGILPDASEALRDAAQVLADALGFD